MQSALKVHICTERRKHRGEAQLLFYFNFNLVFIKDVHFTVSDEFVSVKQFSAIVRPVCFRISASESEFKDSGTVV